MYIILVRDLGMDIDVSQLQSAWESEKQKKNKINYTELILNLTLLIHFSFSLNGKKDILSEYICPDVMHNKKKGALNHI